MKPKTYDAFAIEGSSLKATVQVPESVDEFDKLGGKEGLCLQSGIDNDWYRGGAADLRYFFCQEFESLLTKEFPTETDLKRKTRVTGKKKGSDEDKIVYAEGEAEYVRRALPLLATLRGTEEIKVEEFQPIVDRLLRAFEPADGVQEDYVLDEARARKLEDGTPVLLIRIDPTEREQKERGPKSLPKKYLAAGQQIVKDGQADAFITAWGVTRPEIPADADQAKQQELIAQAIGWKIKSLEDAEAAKINLANKYAPGAAQGNVATAPTETR